MLGAVTPGNRPESVVSQAYYQLIDNPVNKEFYARYRGEIRGHKPINAIGEATYASTLLYAKAVRRRRAIRRRKR